MPFKDPKLELQEFLSNQPAWRRKWLEVDGAFSPEEVQLWGASDKRADFKARSEYEAILQRIPAKWRDYRKKWERIAMSSLPTGSSGRPRRDALAEEAAAHHRLGKSYAEIAIMLGEKYETASKKGNRRPTAESIRKLVKARERDSRADKT